VKNRHPENGIANIDLTHLWPVDAQIPHLPIRKEWYKGLDEDQTTRRCDSGSQRELLMTPHAAACMCHR